MQVGSGTDWVIVTTGDRHACATRTDGTLWCWGANSYGQGGTGGRKQHWHPAEVSGGVTTWAQPDNGALHSCATRVDGTLWCWGANRYGQLGNGTVKREYVPTQVL